MTMTGVRTRYLALLVLSLAVFTGGPAGVVAAQNKSSLPAATEFRPGPEREAFKRDWRARKTEAMREWKQHRDEARANWRKHLEQSKRDRARAKAAKP